MSHKPQFKVISSVDHKNVRVLAHRSEALGDRVMKTRAFPGEFRMLQTEYPVLFESIGNGQYQSVALFGFEAGENLYLNEEGWDADYVPAMLKREPFLINYIESDNGTEERLLALDIAHPRVGFDAGERLFDDFGNRTEFLKEVIELLERLDEGFKHDQQFVEALLQFDLIESVSFDITLNNGDRSQLFGYSTINEDTFQRLSGDKLEFLSKRGFLAPLFMMLASLPNVKNLINRRNKQHSKASGMELFD